MRNLDHRMRLSFTVSLLTINTKRVVDRDTQNMETPGEIKKMAKKNSLENGHFEYQVNLDHEYEKKAELEKKIEL